jgi:hypothetical protein
MCFGKREKSVIDDCLQQLAGLMVTFRTYSGKNIDVSRGDFDINFFKELNNTCSDIHTKLLSLQDEASQKNKNRENGHGSVEMVGANALEIPTLEQ